MANNQSSPRQRFQSNIPEEDRIPSSATVASNPIVNEAEKQLSALTTAVTNVVVNLPVVLETAKGEAPDKAEVSDLVQGLTESLAPIVAPILPERVYKSFGGVVIDTIVGEPELIAHNEGQTLPPEVVDKIVSNVADNITADTNITDTIVNDVQSGGTNEKYYNYYTGEYVNSPLEIVPRGFPPLTETPVTPVPSGTRIPAGTAIPRQEPASTTPIQAVSTPETPASPNVTAAPSTPTAGTKVSEPMSYEQYNAIQNRLPVGERVPYIDYLKSIGQAYYDTGSGTYQPVADIPKREPGTPMSREDWDAIQNKIPIEDRTSYKEYLKGFYYDVSSGTLQPVVDIPKRDPNTPMSREEWDAIQNKLPFEDRVSYEDYLKSRGPSGPLGPSGGAEGAGGAGGGGAEGTAGGETGAGGAGAGGAGAGAGGGIVGGGDVAGGGGAGGGTAGGGPSGPAQTYTAPDGKIFTNIDEYNAYLDKLKADEKAMAGKSAYDLLYDQFNKYGLGALVTPLKDLIAQGLSSAEFAMRLRETPAYQIRFAANKQRINKGLSALSEAEYIGLEDQYQNIMRNYGLPASYYQETIDPVTGVKTQEGFQKFLAGDVSPTELEDRIATAQNRIIYANPEVSIALKNFYPDISNGDLLAYALDPEKALSQIKRRITAAEIGASAVQLGLTTNLTDAEYLARYGVTKEQAQAGYRNVAEVLPRASTLGDIYAGQGLGQYTQSTAEQEMFNVPGAAEAAAKRRKLAELEQAQFSGKAGVGALARERAGGF